MRATKCLRRDKTSRFHRAKYTKTVGLIRVLHEGCERYRNEDLSRVYPQPGTNGPGSTKTLHYYLGRPRQIYKQIGMPPVEEAPIIAFRREWLKGPPATTDPGAGKRPASFSACCASSTACWTSCG